jgi:hypothetical protein
MLLIGFFGNKNKKDLTPDLGGQGGTIGKIFKEVDDFMIWL